MLVTGSPCPPGLRSRALVADDDELFRLAMSALLTRRCGFAEVVEAGSLDEGLARLGAEAEDWCDLALFDLDMPGMAGAASLSAVRECFPDLALAVVTASTRRHDVLVALEAGVNGFLSKGANVAGLAEAVDAIVGGRIFVPPWIARPAAMAAEVPVGRPQAAASRRVGGPATPPQIAQRPTLTQRQSEVLRHVVEGRSNKEIARALSLAEGTVKIHVAALLRAFDAPTRSAVAASGALLLAGA